MSWKKILTDYFTFSRKDRVGIIALLGLILLMLLIPFLYSVPTASSVLKADSTIWNTLRLDSSNKDQQIRNVENQFEAKKYPTERSTQAPYQEKATLFSFDPNTLDAEGWKRLGLGDRITRTILNYRSKGGRFYKKEDLLKIWGLPEGFYQYVESYIQIGSSVSSPIYNIKEKRAGKFAIVDINKSDTSAFIALPGIGNKLAFRIVNFRDKLGGFHSIDQIGETYGLPDSTFQKIKVFLQISGSPIRTINVNTATKDELKAHPYIRWNMANAIVEFRVQHGSFASLEDLKKIDLINDSTFQKIAPYLRL